MTRIDKSSWTQRELTSDQDYQIFHIKDKDLKTISLHSHDFYEVYLFLQGNVTYIIDNDRYSMQKGDILLIPPHSLHQLFIQESENTYDRYVLWLQPSFVASLSSNETSLVRCFDECKARNNYLISNEKVSSQVTVLMHELLLHENDTTFGKDISCNIIISNILLLLSRYLLSSLDIIDISYKKNEENSRITEIIKYIDDNINNDLCLDAIASHMFLSKYYLTRLFKQETGTPIHQYILKRRLVLSKDLISSNMPIVEVYQKCGFNDYSHFFRAFKKEFHLTPREYYIRSSHSAD